MKGHLLIYKIAEFLINTLNDGQWKWEILNLFFELWDRARKRGFRKSYSMYYFKANFEQGDKVMEQKENEIKK